MTLKYALYVLNIGVKDEKNLIEGPNYEGLGYLGELVADCDKLLVFAHRRM